MAQQTIIVESASSKPARKRNKAPFIIAGVALVAMVPIVGSTYAASISVNSGNDIEFGQGSQQTVSCDNSITVTPTAVYAASTDTWALNVGLSGIDATACAGKTIKVTTWDTSNASHDTWTFTLSGSTGSGAGYASTTRGSTGWTYATSSGNYTSTMLSTLNAADLKTVTIETS